MQTSADTSTTARNRQLVLDAAVEALAVDPAVGAESRFDRWDDAGPAVLASLVAASGHPAAHQTACAALDTWLTRLHGGATHPGIFGALTGVYVGACAAASFLPRLRSLAAALRGAIEAWAADSPWRTEAVAWEDYDLISGPAGIVLALAADGACPPRALLPSARHLASLCGGEGLGRLRIGAYRDDPRRAWNFGRVNAGLAHGITGIVAALRVTCEITGSPDEFMVPLRRLCAWLVDEYYVDERGLRTWAPAGRDGARPPLGFSRRQAWCYGTPGAAWALWDAARVLDDAALRAFAEEAMRSFCVAFEDALYIDVDSVSSALGVCHGAAGTLAIADAFARRSGLEEATSLRDHLEEYLLCRIDQIRELAREDMTLLDGAAGILAVLLARTSGQRAWLAHLAVG